MVRIVLITVLVVLLSVFAGCQSSDTGRSQLLPERSKVAISPSSDLIPAGMNETDIIEQVVVNRQAYRQGLEMLIEQYNETGNNMKLGWAEKELEALNRMPQYKYVIDGIIASPNLKAKDSIAEANMLYMEAYQIQKQAEQLVVIKDDDLLRLALDKYNQLIRKYPSSDKIDDAAYRAAGIYEYFNDYTIALLYFQRTYQWDPETVYPARFRAAYLLDKRLHRRSEALELYQEAIVKESQHDKWKDFGEKRIKELTKTDESMLQSR